MKNMTTTALYQNYPWMPSAWVGSGRVIELEMLSDASRKKYAAVKATSAIMRAMRE